MTYPKLITPNSYEQFILDFYTQYKVDIKALHNKQWRQEELHGNSEIQFKVLNYYLAFYYAIIIKEQTDTRVTKDGEFFKELFEVDSIRKCFACVGIDIDEVLELAGIDFLSLTGEVDFPNITALQTLIDNPKGKTTTLNTIC